MASTAVKKTASPKPGDPFRFEGELYTYSGPEDSGPHPTAPGWVAAHRPAKLGKGDTKYKRVRVELKAIQWSEAHKAFYTPGRGVWVHDPKTPPLVRRAMEGGLEPGDDPKEAAAMIAKAVKDKKPYRRPIFIDDAMPPEYVADQIRVYTGEG